MQKYIVKKYKGDAKEGVFECMCCARGADQEIPEGWVLRELWRHFDNDIVPALVCDQCDARKKNHKQCRVCGVIHPYNERIENGAAYDDVVLRAKTWPETNNLCELCSRKFIKANPRELYELLECTNCGMPYEKEKNGATDIHCRDCAKYYQQCPECKEVVHKEEMEVRRPIYNREAGDDAFIRQAAGVCNRCFNRKHIHCACGRYFRKGEHGVVDENCPKCSVNIKPCPVCNKQRPDVQLRRLNGVEMCALCDGELVMLCHECEKYTLDYGTRYHQHKDKDYKCKDCLGMEPVRGYMYHRPVRLFGKGPLFFGIENEYDWRNDYMPKTDALREWVEPRREFYHLTHDGTLKNGVELVTQPASFEHLMGMDEIIPAHIPNEGAAMKTAGCHIHISKEAFKPFHLFKFMHFMNVHFENMSPVFGRGLGNKRVNIEVPLSVYAKNKNNRVKYWWINMASPHTVEMRVFAAASDNKTIRGFLQLLHSVYEYTRDRAVPELAEWKHYYHWLQKRKEYNDVCDMVEKNPKLKGIEKPHIIANDKVRAMGKAAAKDNRQRMGQYVFDADQMMFINRGNAKQALDIHEAMANFWNDMR